MAIMSVKISLLLLLVSVALVLGTQDPELTQCKHQCKVQKQFDESQQRECADDCERYYLEKQRRQREEEGRRGRGDADDVNPDRKAVERLAECESKCEQQRKQGRGRDQQQYQQCQQDCFEEFQRQQRQEGGRDTTYGREREQEREQEQEEGEGERHPYVFQDEHFTAQLKGEAGRVRILQKFTDRSKLLRGIENFRVATLEAEPLGFVIPHHVDADIIYYVAQGRGTFSLIRPGKRESFNIKCGDIFFSPAGITTYLTNTDNNQRLVLIKLLRPVSTPGNFEVFNAAGGENPESFYKSFSSEILEAAFNAKRDTVEKIFRQQRKGVIVKASEEQIRELSRHGEGGIWPFGGESKGVFNLLEQQPKISNQYGRLHLANLDEELSQLEDVNLRVGFKNITQGGMAGPAYHYATKIAIVLNGEGYFEMACPHISQQSSRRGSTTTRGPTYQKVSSRLRRGMVFIVPAGHPIAIVASNNQNLEIFDFIVNAKNDKGVRLAGKNNVVSQFERVAMELAFGVPSRQVEEVFGNQDEDFFFKGPRQQGRAEM